MSTMAGVGLPVEFGSWTWRRMDLPPIWRVSCIAGLDAPRARKPLCS